MMPSVSAGVPWVCLGWPGCGLIQLQHFTQHGRVTDTHVLLPDCHALCR
jgi:hypothetical protein